jgi:hypothetical protein
LVEAISPIDWTLEGEPHHQLDFINIYFILQLTISQKSSNSTMSIKNNPLFTGLFLSAHSGGRF